MSFTAIVLAVIVGTWNGNWFPSGRAEHRANPEVEAATIRATGRIIAKAINAIDPSGREDIIFCVNEVRGPKVAKELATAIGRTNLAVAVVSGYRRRDRFDQQQDVIMTTLPVVDAGWSKWISAKTDTPPRGYVKADLVAAPAVTARVYAVHLKSNYGANSPELRAANARKRANAVEQLVNQERRSRGALAMPVIVCGDFNADKWRAEFAGERLFNIFEEAGFMNALALLPPNERGTHPHRYYGNSALDYIMFRGFQTDGLPQISSSEAISDHEVVLTRLSLSKNSVPPVDSER